VFRFGSRRWDGDGFLLCAILCVPVALGVRLDPSEVAKGAYCHRKLWLIRERRDVDYRGYVPREDDREDKAAGPVSWTAPGYEDLLRNAKATPLRSFKSPLERMNEALAAGREATIPKWRLRAAYGPYVLSGEIDRLRHTTDEARLILDYKVNATPKNVDRGLLQVQIYGLMLELKGKDASKLVVGVASVRRSMPALEGFSAPADVGDVEMDNYGGPVERAAVRLRARMLERGQAQAQTKGKGWTLTLVRYEPSQARACLDALIPAMSKEPPPAVGATPGKCAVCHFNAAGACDVALAEPKPVFVVSKDGDKTVVQRVRLPKLPPDDFVPRRGSRVNLMADEPGDAGA